VEAGCVFVLAGKPAFATDLGNAITVDDGRIDGIIAVDRLGWRKSASKPKVEGERCPREP
jgi:hypothetical protein